MKVELPHLFFISSFFIIVILIKLASTPPSSHRCRRPPGPWRLPIIGNLHHLFGSPPHLALRHLTAIHGPLMLLRLGQLDVAVASSAAAARDLMKTHDLNFASRPSTAGSRAVLYGGAGVAFAPLGPHWRQHRRICSLELLSLRRVRQALPNITEQTNELLSRLHNPNGTEVNLSEELLKFSNAVTARVAFGKRTCAEQETFIAALKEAMKIPGFGFGDLFPSLWWLDKLTGTEARLRRLHRQFDRILDEIIQDHKINNYTDADYHRDDPEDFVDVLLRLQKQGDLEVPFTLVHVKALILDMFIGGTETTSIVLEWAMSELIRNPDCMRMAQSEARSILKHKPNIGESDISELRYLNLVIKETLRLHPPLPLLIPRICKETCEVLGYTIPAGCHVVINGWAILRDPNSWGEDAEEFKPERFQTSSVDFKGKNFEYIPFGSGRRICPGMSFGMTTVVVVMAKLLYHFDWEVVGGVPAEELDMAEEFGATMGRKKGLRVVAVPRISL